MRPIRGNGVALQERDLDILTGLFECRVMTLGHITALYFDGKTEAAKKRIQKLKAGGFIRERARRVGDPSILHIGKSAFVALQESGRLSAYPDISGKVFEKRAQVSDLTLRHELAVMDVRTAFFSAVKSQPNLSITEFSTWPVLYQFTAHHTSHELGRRELLVKPDGFIRIKETTEEGTFEHMFFLEVDRSTESQEIIAQKAACYLDFYQSGGMAKRFGAEREQFKEYPFWVLMVFKSEARRNNAAERLLKNNPPILTQVWMAVVDELVVKLFGDVWVRPKDFLDLKRGGKDRFDCEVLDMCRLFPEAV